MSRATVWLAGFIVFTQFALSPAADDGIVDPSQGEWNTDGGGNGELTGKIIGLGRGEYRATFSSRSLRQPSSVSSERYDHGSYRIRTSAACSRT